MFSLGGVSVANAKYIKMVLILLFAAAFVVPVFAYGGIGVVIDGEPVVFADQAPALIDGRTLVPVRGVFEHLGFEVDWDANTSSAILSCEDFEVIITVGSDIFTTNGARRTLEVPAQSIGGRTMLPIRAVLESVGYAVSWDGATQSVLVSTADAENSQVDFERILEFDTAQVRIVLPHDMNVADSRSHPLPFTDRTYDFTLASPDGVSHASVTVARVIDGQTLSEEFFSEFITSWVQMPLRYSVEDEAVLTAMYINNGWGKISDPFTDSRLVGLDELPPYEYMYLVSFFAHWHDNGAFVFATLLTNDLDSFHFLSMQLSLALMEITFE
jgi:hypothetical protein